jgi:SAM-dependent methyltransferase
MRPEVVKRLIDLNQEFYQTFARSFAETRRRVQPGVRRAIQNVPCGASVLDLGCGNGSLACELARREHHGLYFGLDSSAEMIEIACLDCPHPQAIFEVRDISAPGWSDGLPAPFDYTFAFAILHHIPTQELRRCILETIHLLLKANGVFVFSVWNFLSSARLQRRILPWESVGLSSDDLDSDDILLDWRHGGLGFRYVHAFDEAELTGLAKACGFRAVEKYYADGAEGNLGYYHIWKPVLRHGL